MSISLKQHHLLLLTYKITFVHQKRERGKRGPLFTIFPSTEGKGNRKGGEVEKSLLCTSSLGRGGKRWKEEEKILSRTDASSLRPCEGRGRKHRGGGKITYP